MVSMVLFPLMYSLAVVALRDLRCAHLHVYVYVYVHILVVLFIHLFVFVYLFIYCFSLYFVTGLRTYEIK